MYVYYTENFSNIRIQKTFADAQIIYYQNFVVPALDAARLSCDISFHKTERLGFPFRTTPPVLQCIPRLRFIVEYSVPHPIPNTRASSLAYHVHLQQIIKAPTLPFPIALACFLIWIDKTPLNP